MDTWRKQEDVPSLFPVPTPGPDAELSEWFAERVQKLQRVQNPSRERCQALMLLLQFRYFETYYQATEDQRVPLHAAYVSCYDRVKTLWLDTDPLLPAGESATESAPAKRPQAAGVFYQDMEPGSV